MVYALKPIPMGSSSDHIDLLDGFVDSADALPVLRKKHGRVRHHFDGVATFMHIRAAPFQKVTELVLCNMTFPFSRRADPNSAFAFTVWSFVENLTRGVALAIEHSRYEAPVAQVVIAGRTIDMWCR